MSDERQKFQRGDLVEFLPLDTARAVLVESANRHVDVSKIDADAVGEVNHVAEEIVHCKIFVIENGFSTVSHVVWPAACLRPADLLHRLVRQVQELRDRADREDYEGHYD